MEAETFTPSVDTTFLPKTNGMVFDDRLAARSAKGRVFGLDGSITFPDVPFQTFGTFSITPSDRALPANSTQAFTSSFDGDATDVTYNWSVRSGSASLQSGQGTSSATYFFISPGAVQIQCTATSPNASDSPATFVSMVVVT